MPGREPYAARRFSPPGLRAEPPWARGARRAKFAQQVLGAQLDAAGVLAGVAAQVFAPQNLLVDDQAHPPLGVVHQAQHADAARVQVEELFHKSLPRKAETGHAQLGGEVLGLERLVPGHHQQIELGLLPVAEEQVFADEHLQHPVDVLADLHGGGGGVVGAQVLDPQPVQQIVGAHLARLAAAAIRRPPVKNLHMIASPRPPQRRADVMVLGGTAPIIPRRTRRGKVAGTGGELHSASGK